MSDNINASAELSVAELSSELESVRNKLQAAEQKIMQLELSLLQSRDFSIGTAAEMGEMRVGHNTIIEKLKDANIHIKSHLAHIKRLEEAMVELNRASALHRARSAELDRVYNSASWKIGRFIMIPIRILRKISS
jgi:chromosome segregation ATPase